VTWSVNQLRRWLDEVEPIADRRTPFEWLEIAPTASSVAVQEGYHRVARTRHPDLFRLSLDPAEMDRLVRMYSRVSWAYAELRDPDRCAAALRYLRGTGSHATAVDPRGTGSFPTISDPRRRTGTGDVPSVATNPPRPAPDTRAAATAPRGDPPTTMNPRAATFYQRAMAAQQSGDPVSAALNLRMALAADPSSTFLRDAVAAFERKRP